MNHLHRTDPLNKIAEEEIHEGGQKDVSDCVSTTSTANANTQQISKKPSRANDKNKWWSYDSILGWPEKLPSFRQQSDSLNNNGGRHRKRFGPIIRKISSDSMVSQGTSSRGSWSDFELPGCSNAEEVKYSRENDKFRSSKSR